MAHCNEDVEEYESVLDTIGIILGNLCTANDAELIGRVDRGRSLFVGDSIPRLSIRQYLARLAKYLRVSMSCYVASVVLLDRVLTCGNTAVVLYTHSVYNLVLTSVLLSVKYLEDRQLSMSYFAKVGCVDPLTLCEYERAFLASINFAVHINSDVYARYRECLDHRSIAPDP